MVTIVGLLSHLSLVQIRVLGQEAERLTRSQPANLRLIRSKEKEVNDAWTSLRLKVCACERGKEGGSGVERLYHIQCANTM